MSMRPNKPPTTMNSQVSQLLPVRSLTELNAQAQHAADCRRLTKLLKIAPQLRERALQLKEEKGFHPHEILRELGTPI